MREIDSHLISDKKREKSFILRQMMGCPFFNKEITDPEGKNITQGYP